MRWLLTLITTTLLGACATACGGAEKTIRPASTGSSGAAASPGAPAKVASGSATEPKRDSDGDNDNPGNSYYDRDDAEVLSYGAPARPSDMRQVATLVKRYYMAGVAGDGAAGCTLMYSIFAESIVDDAGQGAGPSAPGGRTCAEVISRLFKRERRRMAAALAKLRVVWVRVVGNRGFALLGSGARPERYLQIHRESGGWRVEALVDEGLP